WRSLLRGRSKSVLERDVLPAFLASRRWYAERGNPPTTHIVGGMPIAAAESDLGVALLQVRGRRETANYLLPLTIKWTRFDRERQNPSALAAVRGHAKAACSTPRPIRALSLVSSKTCAARTTEDGQRRIEFAPTASFPKDVPVAIEDVRAVAKQVRWQMAAIVVAGASLVGSQRSRRPRPSRSCSGSAAIQSMPGWLAGSAGGFGEAAGPPAPHSEHL